MAEARSVPSTFDVDTAVAPMSPFRVLVDRQELVAFAEVIGEHDSVYSDVDIARAAGHPDVPVPPTFLFSLELRRPDPYSVIEDLGLDYRRLVHGEEEISLFSACFAGETLEFRPRISDIRSKKNGSLIFIERTTEVLRDHREIARLRNLAIVRMGTS
jgi:acyl dehydratase